MFQQIIQWWRGTPEPATFLEATPGRWYGDYHDDWNTAHPGAWMRGELEVGGWNQGSHGEDVWCSGTLDWDRDWFAAHGMDMPRHHRHAEPDNRPNVLRIGDLGPGESGTIPIVIAEHASQLEFTDDDGRENLHRRDR